MAGLAVGALGLGIASYVTADSSSLVFSPGEQAFFGGVVGAFAGALPGLLLWASVVGAERAYQRFRRAREHRP